MNKHPDYILKQIDDEYVLVPLKASSIDFKHYIRLNESAAFLYEQLDTFDTKEALIETLRKHYDLDEAKAKEAVEAFLAMMTTHGLLNND